MSALNELLAILHSAVVLITAGVRFAAWTVVIVFIAWLAWSLLVRLLMFAAGG